jgi:DNA-binding Lrp family transcriptional regulator
MDNYDLDRTDMGILYLLQRNARDTTTEEIAEKVGLAASTVATRIRKLENADVIQDYRPTINYRRAGFDQHVLVIGTVPADERTALVEKAMDVGGVVNARELMTDEENVLVELVSASQETVERRIDELSDIGVEINRTELLTRELTRPFAHFGEQFTDEG